MKKLLFLISMVVFVNLIFAQTATLKIGSVYDPSPGLIDIPVTIEALENPIIGSNLVSSLGFFFAYDASVLGNTVNFIYPSPAPFPGAVTNVTLNYPQPGWNTISFVYAAATSTNVVVPETVITLRFTYTSGSTDIIWGSLNTYETIMTDDEGNDFILTLENGCACISGYDILFQVTDDSGTPLQDAMVTIGTESIPTDASGEAVFNRPDGDYTYAVTKAGYYDISDMVTVAGTSQTVPVTMYLLGSEFDVTFHVTDGTDNLVGAMVTVGSQSKMTDMNGEAVFSRPNGNYNYNVSKYGYTSDAGSFTVAGMAQTIEVMLTMLPHYDITFHVTSGVNNIEGASIAIPGVGTLLTNINGEAVFSLIDGTYNYTITKTGYASKTSSLMVAGSAFTVEETLEPIYSITIHVTTGSNNLQGATVTVGMQSLVTDASGNAIFNLPDGDYSYTVTKAGYNSETGPFTVNGAPATIEVAMTLVEYEVTFHITSEGNNLEGVLIGIDNGASATTDVNGNAMIMLPDGEFVYTATKAGYGVEQDVFTVSGGPMTVNIIMTPLPTYAVTFHVTATGGANLEGALVTVGTENATTNASGIAIINLGNGNYNYTVTKLGYVNQSGNFLVINGPVNVSVVMPLALWATTVHVTTEGTNLGGALVTVNPGNLTALTGSNGNALFNLVNGSYTYTVEKVNYVTQTGSIVVENATQTIQVDMPFAGWQTTFHCISGGPLEGVDVTCNGQTITSDSNGDAIFYLLNGTYSYTADKPGYNTATGTVTVNGANQTKNILMIPTQYSVTFIVTSSGAPVAGAVVTLGGTPQTTPANGTVVFQKANGTYNWTVTHPDYESQNGSVTVNNGPETIDVLLTVGINDISANSFNVYPNPSDGSFTLTTSAVMGYESNVSVYDLAGKLVYSGKMEGNDLNVIDLTDQQKGTYFLQIIVDNKVFNKTLVIQ